MKYPITDEQARAMFIKTEGEEPSEDVLSLIVAAFSLANKAYEDGKRDALAAMQKEGIVV